MVHKLKIKALHVKTFCGPKIINLKICSVAAVCDGTRVSNSLRPKYGKLLASYCACEQPLHVRMFYIHQALEDSRVYDERIRKEEEEKRKQEEEKRKQEKEANKSFIQKGWECMVGKSP